ncbi:hypothetical protein RM717_05490 [Streptomyces griseus]|uniref:Uncharacterized protein n=2 Tax=Streptomycetaceae TaxID=2062 RepID=A0ABU2VWH5_9ACTN|nr:hypothetical protein [Streptomyces griseus]ARF74267.1 hypothetical protein B7C62_20025 [Kitasatospora albolonga]MDT0489951.1 hypothetical protein [Streptomyces griseus]
MHTTATAFTLRAWAEGRTHERRTGYRGTSPEFGEIVLTAPLPRKNTPGGLVSEVRGPSIPTATFESRGIHTEAADLPTLNGSVLRVGDALVHLRRNRFGLTRRARALHFRYGGDRYRLWAAGRKKFVLRREADDEDPGVSATATRSGFGGSRKVVVRVSGRALAADIALVALFAGVDRAPLTRGGAVRAALARSARLFAESRS